MTFDDVKRYVLQHPQVELTYPFGADVLVFKIQGKMFATLGMNKGEGNMNLKCDPHEALILREIFAAVIPGYHMNKKHWNTIILNNSVPRGEIERMIANSFQLVVDNFSKKQQLSIIKFR